jgi:hypothetical protein
MSDLGTEDLRRGLAPGARFRCDGCGNVTRFDVVATARTRRYHHFDLGGVGRVEEEEILAETVESVTCHWCGRADGVRVEPAPGYAAGSEPAAGGTTSP